MHSLFDERRYLIPFRSSLLPQIFTETLVIGGGVAGLRAAIAAAESGGNAGGGGEVILLTKDGPEMSNTAWAQGGIAAALGEGDSVDSHVADTIAAGGGLCDEPIVRRICEGGPSRIRELLDWGMRVDRAATKKDEGAAEGDELGGGVALGMEAAHSHARIIHADGDATGRELARCLWQKVKSTPGVRVFEKCFSLDLITPSNEVGSPVMGAITHHPRYGLQMIWARNTILATGGAGMVYRETTNPRTATADGLAMAYRAGASIADMSFVQFHPTTLYLAGVPRSLISEAVRGEGAYLLDESGHRFMRDVHPDAELAPRDVVSRGIVRRLATHGGTHVYLDVRHIAGFGRRFPGIAAMLAKYELDPSKDLIPVNPACHYTIGGVVSDDRGRTDVPGLFAVGEVASTGLHGANRLASNSLLEGLVMGEIAGRTAREMARAHPAASPPVPIISDIRPSEHGEIDLSDVLSSLRSAMWRNAGIERSGNRLADACEMIDFWARYTLDKIFDAPDGWQTQNLLLVAALIARSAAWRQESRGAHWRSDVPEAKAEFRVHDRWRRGRGDTPTLAPVDDGEPAKGRGA